MKGPEERSSRGKRRRVRAVLLGPGMLWQPGMVDLLTLTRITKNPLQGTDATVEATHLLVARDVTADPHQVLVEATMMTRSTERSREQVKPLPQVTVLDGEVKIYLPGLSRRMITRDSHDESPERE